MQFVGRVFSTVSEFYKDLNPSTLSGAIDVIVIERPDGSLWCSPFHVRFGKLSLLRPQEKVVEIRVNQLPVDFAMKVGEAGEAFFVVESLNPVPSELQTSPVNPPMQPTPEMASVTRLDLTPSALPPQSSSMDQNDTSGFVSPHSADGSDFDGEDLLVVDGVIHQHKSGNKPSSLKPSSIPSPLKFSSEVSFTADALDLAQPSDTLKASTSSSFPYHTPTQYFHTAYAFDNNRPLSDTEAENQQHLDQQQQRSQQMALHQGPLSDTEMDYSYPQQSGGLEDVEVKHRSAEWNWTWGDIPAQEGQDVEKVDGLVNEALLTLSAPPFDESRRIMVLNEKKLVEVEKIESRDGKTGEIRSIGNQPDGKIVENAKLDSSKSQNVDIDTTAVEEGISKKVEVVESQSSVSAKEIVSVPKPALEPISEDRSLSPRKEVSVGNILNTQPIYITKEDLKFVEISSSSILQSITPENIDRLFNEFKVPWDQAKSNPQLLTDSQTIFRIRNKYYTGSVAVPAIMAVLVYNEVLPDASLNLLFPKSPLSQTTSAPPVSSSTSVGGWRQWWTRGTSVTRTSTSPEKISRSVTSPLPSTLPPLEEKEKIVDEKKVVVLPKIDESPAKPQLSVETSSQKRYTKTLRLNSSQLKSLNLKEGPNDISFTVNTRLQGQATCNAKIYLWKYDVQVVVSDIDGTITKSDALGHLFTFVGKDWTHPGIAKLYTNISRNGYQILYLTSRAIGQADTTRAYLRGIEQGKHTLPQGPVIMSPDRLMTALKREVIDRRPEEFKIACLKDILRLFGGRNPFYAGFGNRVTDAISYRTVGIPTFRIYSINSYGEVKMDFFLGYSSSYFKLTDMVDHIFPPNKLRFLTTSDSAASLLALPGTPEHLSSSPSNALSSTEIPAASSAQTASTTTDALLQKSASTAATQQQRSYELVEDDYNDFNYWREPLMFSDLPELQSTPNPHIHPALAKLTATASTSSATGIHVSQKRKKRRPQQQHRHSVAVPNNLTNVNVHHPVQRMHTASDIEFVKGHIPQKHSLDAYLTSLSDREYTSSSRDDRFEEFDEDGSGSESGSESGLEDEEGDDTLLSGTQDIVKNGNSDTNDGGDGTRGRSLRRKSRKSVVSNKGQNQVGGTTASDPAKPRSLQQNSLSIAAEEEEEEYSDDQDEEEWSEDEEEMEPINTYTYL